MSPFIKNKFSTGQLIGIGCIIILICSMIYSTKIIPIGSEHDIQEKQFSPVAFGAAQFPKIQAYVTDHAVDAAELANLLAADKKSASEKYATQTSTGPIFSVKFTAIVSERKGNMNVMSIEGMPTTIKVRVQTGPALNGTDLRDVTGTFAFGDFKNQIEYQDAGSAINNEVKSKVLENIKPEALNGKTVEVIGVFKLINPKNWLVIPVRFTIK